MKEVLLLRESTTWGPVDCAAAICCFTLYGVCSNNHCMVIAIFVAVVIISLPLLRACSGWSCIGMIISICVSTYEVCVYIYTHNV